MTDANGETAITANTMLGDALPSFCLDWYPAATRDARAAREARRARNSLACFCNWYEHAYGCTLAVSDVTPRVINQFAHWGRGALSSSSRAYSLRMLRAFGEWACSKHILTSNPAKFIRHRRAQPTNVFVS